MRFQNYAANNLNQYTQRTVPGYIDVQGSATNTATVTVNDEPTYRKSEYFRAELAVDNGAAPVLQGITNVAVIPQGTNADIVTNITGNILVPKFTEVFFYDADGNQLSDSLWTNIWNGENRLIATESASGVPTGGKTKQTWSHLADGRWYERVIFAWNGITYAAQSTNRFVWDGQVLLGIVDHTNGLVMSFPRGLDLSGSIQGAGGVGGVLALDVVTNGVHFMAYDGNGNVSALVATTSGATTAEYEYSPFGETLRSTGPMARNNPLRFSTQFADDVANVAKYLFRDYHPAVGRWPNRDPIGELGHDGPNLSAFVRNTPPNLVDTDGQESFGIYFDPNGNWAYPHGLPKPPNPYAGRKKCGTVVTRAIGPYSGFIGQIGNACSRCVLPHEFIIAGDGSDGRFDFKGDANQEGHWTASSSDIWITENQSCKNFNDCLEREFKKIFGDTSNPYDFTKNCQSAVRTALKRCGGFAGLRPSLPPVTGFPK